MMVACKSLVTVIIIVSLFGLHQCQDDLHPKGIERCSVRFVGKPYTIEDLCCSEAPWICFAGYLRKECIKRCPPLRGVPPSPPHRKRAPLRKRAVSFPPPPKGAPPSPSPSPSPMPSRF